VDPAARKSKLERVEPKRMTLRMLTLLPRLTESSIDSADPIDKPPKNDKLDPNRIKLRKDMQDPGVVTPRTEHLAPPPKRENRLKDDPRPRILDRRLQEVPKEK
jgi:hypothetical protein